MLALGCYLDQPTVYCEVDDLGVDEGNREEAVGGDLGEAGAELGESPDQVRIAGSARYVAFLPARVENF